MDRRTPEQRSALMSRIRGKDTGPELRVRRIAHAAGYRYRLHGKVSRAEARRAPGGKLPGGKLPGRPDLVFAGSRKAVFVNGCFWHMHDCPAGRVAPASNAEFWSAKREATVARDARNTGALEAMGWSVLTLWECQLKDPDQVLDRLDAFLGAPPWNSRPRPSNLLRLVEKWCHDVRTCRQPAHPPSRR